MSTYAQPGGKRQKVKEGRAADSVDYFQGIEKVEFNTAASATDTLSYRYYNAAERLHSKTMEDWLKYSLSFTEFRTCSAEYPRTSNNRPWDDNSHSMDNYKRCIKAFFDLCTKLGVKYWTAYDSDLLHLSDSWEENKTNFDEIVEYIHELGQRYHVKLLWLAPDLHTHPRYTTGAFTNNDANVFAHAATQIKKCLEVSQRLNAECFLIWPHREGYDAIFQSDVARELKLFVKLLKITAEYKDRLNSKLQLLIMPYRFNGMQKWRDTEILNHYMWDITSCLFFLKNYGLDRQYKVCSPPGHHMYMANAYNMLGGVTIINEYDLSQTKSLTLMMKSIIDQNTAPLGGINLKLRLRRDADARDAAVCYVKYIDVIAKALRVACNIVGEQIFSKHVQQRYISYYSGFGARVVSADVTLEECEEYYKKNQVHEVTNSKCEHFDFVFQRYLDSCDHI
ncbi:xylose isomerase-like isoform X1 [Zerene cesonia]|uniref:xylose isomerase-like isoform X1 n=1 Tax=Zerene cesonia TaxID=33412 RepID=UPI0018E5350C|nr:xylose isomerase-like isoform X1 [Zerene cesonia]